MQDLNDRLRTTCIQLVHAQKIGLAIILSTNYLNDNSVNSDDILIFLVDLPVWLIICLISNSWLICFTGLNCGPVVTLWSVLMLFACCNHGSRTTQTCLNTSFLIISLKSTPLQVMEAKLCICKNVTNFTLRVISTSWESAPLLSIWEAESSETRRVGDDNVDLLKVGN